MIRKIRRTAGKIPGVLWLLGAAFLTEVFVCNFSAWESRFFPGEIFFRVESAESAGVEDIDAGLDFSLDLGTAELETAEDGALTVTLRAEGRTLHNLYFDAEVSGQEMIPYTVTLTDAGNYYPYSLPEQELVPWVSSSFFTRLYPAGGVGELSVRFQAPEGCRLRIRGVLANTAVPVSFHFVRFLAVFFTLLLFRTVRRPGAAQGKLCFEKGSRTGRIQLMVTAAVVLLLMGAAWKLAHMHPVCIASPWPHHRQYQELASALSGGHAYLDAEPSKELKSAPNPYDTIYLQANGIDYRADYAYRDGKYYVYFGIVPELVFYLPCYLLTGKLFPNWLAVLGFFCGFIAAVFALYREVVKRWFPETPFLAYLIISTLTVCCGNYLFMIARPDLYNIPIIAAVMFTAAGLWLWIRGKYGSSSGERRLCLCAGSLCMALVAGCRPQLLLFSFAAVPLFWKEVMKERRLFSLRSVKDTACIVVPYAAVAAGIMYYNAVRFGSPFDFGAAYSLTSNDMTKRSFNLQQALLGLWHFLFRPPVVESGFPFLQGVQIASGSYMGKLNAEYTCGGLLVCNVFTWILLFAGKAGRTLREKGLWTLTLTGIAVSAVLAVVDVTGAGILQRYMADMVWGIWFSSSLLWLTVMEKAKNTAHYRTVMTLLAAVCVLQAAYAFGVIFGNGDLSVNVRVSNPVLYQKVKALFWF